jgi:hypothetical protein
MHPHLVGSIVGFAPLGILSDTFFRDPILASENAQTARDFVSYLDHWSLTTSIGAIQIPDASIRANDGYSEALYA